jgi:mannosyltransferase OCH1-like enzyme
MINGSLKADFFRYCVIYIHGGLYIDVDISCEKPLKELFNFDEINFITATDNCKVQRSDRIYQGFLGGEANCRLFKMMIDHICSSIEHGKFKTNLFDLSGPVIFSKKLKEYMNTDIKDSDQCKFLKELTFINTKTNHKFVIVQHDISKEKLQMNNVIFATAQHKIDRKKNPHYFKNRSTFRKGYYE